MITKIKQKKIQIIITRNKILKKIWNRMRVIIVRIMITVVKALTNKTKESFTTVFKIYLMKCKNSKIKI